MPVLWPVISSLHAPRSRMGRIAAARGALYMLSVQPREQQVAEKPYGEHLYTSYHITVVSKLAGQLLYRMILL